MISGQKALYHDKRFKYLITFSSYRTKYMIEMDQFVHTLSGDREEIISRDSKQSAATMKDMIGTTIKKFFSF